MTLKNNRAPLLSNIKLYASFHHHMWIQTGVTVRKRLSWVVTSVTLTFDLWPWPFAWTLLWSLVITPENFMMIGWWEHSQKGVTDRRTDGRTDGQTENTICRAAWSQLKKHDPVFKGSWTILGFLKHDRWMFIIKNMCVASLTLIFKRSVVTLQPTRPLGRMGSMFNWPSEDWCQRSHSKWVFVCGIKTGHSNLVSCFDPRTRALAKVFYRGESRGKIPCQRLNHRAKTWHKIWMTGLNPNYDTIPRYH